MIGNEKPEGKRKPPAPPAPPSKSEAYRATGRDSLAEAEIERLRVELEIAGEVRKREQGSLRGLHEWIAEHLSCDGGVDSYSMIALSARELKTLRAEIERIQGEYNARLSGGNKSEMAYVNEIEHLRAEVETFRQEREDAIEAARKYLVIKEPEEEEIDGDLVGDDLEDALNNASEVLREDVLERKVKLVIEGARDRAAARSTFLDDLPVDLEELTRAILRMVLYGEGAES